MRSRSFIGFGSALMLGAGGAWVWACGPFLSSAFLSMPKAVLTPPETHFVVEMKQLKQRPSPPRGVKSEAAWPTALPSTLEVDVGDLQVALEKAGIEEGEREHLVRAYAALRQSQLQRSSDKQKALPAEMPTSLVGDPKEGQRWLAEGRWPEMIPLEFRLYVEGAELCYQRNDVGAKERWQQILALPKEQRRYRGTWAAWMIGRLSSERTEAHRWYGEVGCLVEEEGALDSLRLAAAAAGRLARFEDDPAVILRTRFYNFRDNQRPKYEKELLLLKSSLAEQPETMKQLSTAPDVVETVSAMLVHHGRIFHPGSNFQHGEAKEAPNTPGALVRAWFDLLESAKTPRDALPPQVGIAAYRAGDFKLAEKALNRATKTWESEWILGKLALQKGNKDEGAGHLANALRKMPKTERQMLASVTDHDSVVYEGDWWSDFRNDGSVEEDGEVTIKGLKHSRLLADLGTVKLSQSDFVGALKLFGEANCPHDAAYVAERLLSVEELLSAVRRWKWDYTESHGAEEKPGNEYELDYAVKKMLGSQGDEDPEINLNQRTKARVRYLLARRLARDRFFKDAREFYPPALLPFFDRYVALYRRGHGSTFPQEVRAAALWEAARMERMMGAQLFGTDGEPDGLLYDCSFPYRRLSNRRDSWRRGMDFTFAHSNDGDEKINLVGKEVVPRPSAQESQRAKKYQLKWEKRFQYRYTAADLAWEAAKLMPGNSESTAAVYHRAGLWIEHRDPKAADRFYKAMIWRNWNTPLARAADKKRWFPEPVGMERYDPFAAIGTPLPGD